MVFYSDPSLYFGGGTDYGPEHKGPTQDRTGSRTPVPTLPVVVYHFSPYSVSTLVRLGNLSVY